MHYFDGKYILSSNLNHFCLQWVTLRKTDRKEDFFPFNLDSLKNKFHWNYTEERSTSIYAHLDLKIVLNVKKSFVSKLISE